MLIFKSLNIMQTLKPLMELLVCNVHQTFQYGFYAMGYSVKARGIARDLFAAEEHYVLPVQSLEDKDDLVKGFAWLRSHETDIKETLENRMPDYQRQALETGNEVDRLWEEFSQQQKI